MAISMNPIEASIPDIISGVNIVNSPILAPINAIIHSFLFIESIPAIIGKIASMHPIIPYITSDSSKKNCIQIIIARNPDIINNIPAISGMNGLFAVSIVIPFL